MEVEEIQTQVCKFSRVGNGRNNNNNNNSAKIGSKGDQQYPDDEDDAELESVAATNNGGGGGGGGESNLRGGASNRLREWHPHPSSRIIRVSRASGGKDRHSKVWTSKGLRDRRVRLSVTTAIQFYDLQDRLGYDQPSKAVEWLIKAAADAIAELPSLNSAFPETPKQLSDEQGFDSADVDPNSFGQNHNQNQSQSQHLSLSKSACSSTSDTSKGSGLSLSRSDVRVNRVRARERARERAAKEKEKETECRTNAINPISQSSSFTELLTGGINNVNNQHHHNNNDHNTSPSGTAHQNPTGEPNFFQNKVAAAAVARQWPAGTPLDYFGPGLLGRAAHHSSAFQLGNSLPHSISMSMSMSPFNVSNENHQELQPPPHFPFNPDHLIPVTSTAAAQQHGGGGGGDYNLNFSISPSLAGFNSRGTLQSNSSSPSLLGPSLLPRFAPTIDGSNLPFLIGTTTTQPSVENHHHQQFPPGLDGRLQLCYGDGTGSRHSDQKGKGKH